MAFFKCESAGVTEISENEARDLQKQEGFGFEFVTAQCENTEEALNLIHMYEDGAVEVDNLPGGSGLVGLYQQPGV